MQRGVQLHLRSPNSLSVQARPLIQSFIQSIKVQTKDTQAHAYKEDYDLYGYLVCSFALSAHFLSSRASSSVW